MTSELEQTRLFADSLNKSFRFLEHITSLPAVLVLAFVSVLFPLLLFPMYGPGNMELLDLHFSYNSELAYRYLEEIGEKGRNTYLSFALSCDLIFPVFYSLTLSMALLLIVRRLPQTNCIFRYICLFPSFIVVADWFENLNLACVIHAFPKRLDSIAGFASFFTSLKWLLIILTVIMLSVLLVYSIAIGSRGTSR